MTQNYNTNLYKYLLRYILLSPSELLNIKIVSVHNFWSRRTTQQIKINLVLVFCFITFLSVLHFCQFLSFKYTMSNIRILIFT